MNHVQLVEHQAYHLLQDLRLLARRDDGQLDQELEGFRQEFLEAFEAFQDLGNETKLTPFILEGERIIGLGSNRELVRWLRRQLEAQADPD